MEEKKEESKNSGWRLARLRTRASLARLTPQKGENAGPHMMLEAPVLVEMLHPISCHPSAMKKVSKRWPVSGQLFEEEQSIFE